MLTLDWYRFIGTQLGVIAGLTGFVLIAVSINLRLILDSATLPGRSAESLIAPVGAITLNGLILLPDQPPTLLGAEIVAVGFAMVAVPIVIQARTWRQSPVTGGKRVDRFLISAGVSFLFVIEGALIAFGAPSGLYWIAAGDLLVVLSIVVTAWVLMVEIQR